MEEEVAMCKIRNNALKAKNVQLKNFLAQAMQIVGTLPTVEVLEDNGGGKTH